MDTLALGFGSVRQGAPPPQGQLYGSIQCTCELESKRAMEATMPHQPAHQTLPSLWVM